jgi:hypothetical protein
MEHTVEEFAAMKAKAATKLKADMEKWFAAGGGTSKKAGSKPREGPLKCKMYCTCVTQDCHNQESGGSCFACVANFKAGVAMDVDQYGKCTCVICRCVI